MTDSFVLIGFVPGACAIVPPIRVRVRTPLLQPFLPALAALMEPAEFSRAFQGASSPPSDLFPHLLVLRRSAQLFFPFFLFHDTTHHDSDDRTTASLCTR